MDEQACFERLDSTAEDPADLFEHVEHRAAAGRTYHVFPDPRHGVERGTVLLDDVGAIVRGYPSIPRILVLDPGVRSFFEGVESIVVEEKLDGFNVRIAAVEEPLAFTRGGLLCPYTTARARDLLDLPSFFADYPEKMVCAELVGPETPYTSHDYDDVEFDAIRVFGIRERESGEPLPVDERRALCKRYGFPQPKLFGRFDPDEAVEGVCGAIDDLDAAGREGVVMKSTAGEPMVKYTTEAQHHADLAHAFGLPFDYGRDFLFSRIVRDAFQAVEYGEDDDRLRERARDMGESILLPMVETIRAVDAGETVGERHTVRGDPSDVEELLDHLRDQSLTLAIESDRREGDQRVVEFVKIAGSTRDRVQYYLDGGTVDE